MALGDQRRAQAAAGAFVVALRAGQFQLTDPLPEQRFAARQVGLQPRVTRRGDGQAARLHPDEGFQRQQVRVLRWQLGLALLPLTAKVDARAQVDRTAQGFVPARVARRHAAHRRRLAVAAGARPGRGGRRAPPQLFAFLHEEHGGVQAVVPLHRLRRGTHVVEPGAPRVHAGRRGASQQQQGEDAGDAPRQPHHATCSVRRSVCAKPLSPCHSNSSVPLSAASTWNER
jgi:hypothetical protein